MGLAEFPCSSQLIIVGCLCFCLGVIVATAIILIGWVSVQWKKRHGGSSSSSTSSECEAYRQNRRHRQNTCSSHLYHTSRDLILQNNNIMENKSNRLTPSLPSPGSLGIISDINLHNETGVKGSTHLTGSNGFLRIDCPTPSLSTADQSLFERNADSYGAINLPPRNHQHRFCCDKWNNDFHRRNSPSCYSFANSGRLSTDHGSHKSAERPPMPYLYGCQDLDSISGIPEYPAPVPATDVSGYPHSEIPCPESIARADNASPSWQTYFYEKMQFRNDRKGSERSETAKSHSGMSKPSENPTASNAARRNSSSHRRPRELLRHKSSCQSRASSGEYMAMRHSAILHDMHQSQAPATTHAEPGLMESVGMDNYLYAKPLTKKQREKAAKTQKKRDSNYQTL